MSPHHLCRRGQFWTSGFSACRSQLVRLAAVGICWCWLIWLHARTCCNDKINDDMIININNWTVVNFCVLHAIFGQHYRFWPVLNRHYWVVMFSILGSDSLVRTSAWGGGCRGVERRGQGGCGSILADILRTSCMDDPLYKRAYIWK